MDENTVNSLERPGEDGQDTLTPLLQEGARRLLAEAIEAEVEAFVTSHEHIRDESGRRLVIRNGYLAERTIQSGIGDIAVKAHASGIVADRVSGSLPRFCRPICAARKASKN